MTKEPDTAALMAHNEHMRQNREALPQAIRELEQALNEALLLCDDPTLRRVLLDARGNIREAMGEART
jgi:hypothetical protein